MVATDHQTAASLKAGGQGNLVVEFPGEGRMKSKRQGSASTGVLHFRMRF